MEQRRYKAIFFDLDGTLLPIDMDEFLHRYFIKLRIYVTRLGLDAERFSYALNEGMKSMGADHPGKTNREAFWSTFNALFGESADTMENVLLDFYENDFGEIGAGIQPNPAARRVVEDLRKKGYPLYLTTMPMFPESALNWRLKWADVDPSCFERKTTYDNSSALKPSLSYYRQNIRIVGCKPEEVLMVGNNTREDLAILELGADAFLITDHMLDPVNFPIDTIKNGSLQQFADWAANLSECEE